MKTKYYNFNPTNYLFWSPFSRKYASTIHASGDILWNSVESMTSMNFSLLKYMVEEKDLDFIYQFYYD